MTTEPRKPFNARCGRCGHVWALLYTPMPLADAARVMANATCPSCSAPSREIRVASEREPS